MTNRTLESTITEADIRAWRFRNPLPATRAEVVAAILREHPCDVGFAKREAL